MEWARIKVAVLSGFGILLAAGIVSLAVKQIAVHRTPAWQKKYDLSLLDGLPPQVQLRPSLQSTTQSNFHALGYHEFRGLGLGQSVPELFRIAYGIIPSRIILSVPVTKEEYDVIITYPNMKEGAKVLQEDLKKKFGLVARRVMIETNVFILTVQHPNAAGFKPSTSPFSNDEKPGAYSVHGATLYTLVSDLEDYFGVAVINETNIKGKFDIDLKWDSTSVGLTRALRDDLGLTLTPDRKIVAYSVIEKAP